MLPEDEINERFKEYKVTRMNQNVPWDTEAVALKFFLFQELALVNASFERVSSRLDSLMNKLEEISPVSKVPLAINLVADSFVGTVLTEEKARILPGPYGPNGEPWNTNPKTVLAWLEQANLFGCSWAKSAIDQIDPAFKEELVESLQKAVACFVFWGDTCEKSKYWHDIYVQIGESKF